MASCFVYKVIRELESIDHLCINPIHRKGLIHKLSIDSHLLKWSVQVNVLLNDCKQNTTSLSLLVGTAVDKYAFIIKNLSYFSIKHPKGMFKVIDKKILAILCPIY